MRPLGGSLKKLIVAFHFQFAKQAGWKCDDCRRQALQEKRNCGWLGLPPRPAPVVWARGGAVTTECPRSYVTAESLCLIEEFFAWKTFGHADYRALPARMVDAFEVLELELAKERTNAER
ncbi:MAG: hypothetical protein HYZ57_15960 [Acidobacteria bacterium]|nr:hypothetical protein [Acidobacteriota bacterium]